MILKWVYWKDKQNTIVDLIQNQLFINHLGYDAGTFGFTLLKIAFWYFVSWLLARNEIFLKV
jgi:hypothetical protein